MQNNNNGSVGRSSQASNIVILDSNGVLIGECEYIDIKDMGNAID